MHGAETLISAARGGTTAIVIGVQSRTADFKETERYAKQAEKLGADAIICIAPPGVTDASELLRYYQRLGKVTSLPLFAQTGGDFSVDLIVEMFNTIPTFRYVKDEAGDPLERVTEIRRRTNDQLNCFSGKGVTTMITEMERGFVGHCPFVSLADLYASAYDSYHAGKAPRCVRSIRAHRGGQLHVSAKRRQRVDCPRCVPPGHNHARCPAGAGR